MREDAVPQHVELQIAESVRRITSARQHVMPLQDLMQHDAVEKAAKAEAEENAGCDRKWRRGAAPSSMFNPRQID